MPPCNAMKVSNFLKHSWSNNIPHNTCILIIIVVGVQWNSRTTIVYKNERIYFSAILDVRISAFRKDYNTKSILLKAVENWRMALYEGKYVRVILMDLSKAFDVIPHGLLIAKLYAYGCDENVLNLMLSYLTDRKQRTKLCTSRSDWKTLNKGLPQGSLLWPPMFNIFMNDMFLIIEMCEDYNYADDNTIYDVKYIPDELKLSLEHDASNVTDWFHENGMKTNTDKYQGIVVGVKPDCPMSFTVKGITVECKDEVKLLCVYIDSQLTFSIQISFICQKAGQQTDAIMRLSTIIGMEGKLFIYQAFILSNFKYFPVVWILFGQGNVKKMEHIQLKTLNFVFNDFTLRYA